MDSTDIEVTDQITFGSSHISEGWPNYEDVWTSWLLGKFKVESFTFTYADLVF